MLQQQINSAQLHNLAAVQQVTRIMTGKGRHYKNMRYVTEALHNIPFILFLNQATLAASRQSNTPSNSMSQTTTTVSFVVSCLSYDSDYELHS